MIWCVEDDESIRDIETYSLQMTGFTARGFEDGGSFLEALKEEKPDLVILDIMLPGMDGVELLRRLKEDQDTADIPVIMLTGVEDKSSVLESARLGICDYTLKPFSSEDLLARIRRVLKPDEEGELQKLWKEGGRR